MFTEYLLIIRGKFRIADLTKMRRYGILNGSKPMAERTDYMEKYGTIPPKFTKDWCSYIADYYKWHIITAVCVVIAVAATVVQCSSRINPDLSVMVAGDLKITHDPTEELSEACSEFIEDIDNDGVRKVTVQLLSFNSGNDSDINDIEYESALRMKFTADLQACESFLFILTDSEVESIRSQGDSMEGVFANASEWCDGAGEEPFVSLAGNAFLEQRGFITDNLYMAVRNIRLPDLEKEKMQKNFANAKRLAAAIINNG